MTKILPDDSLIGKQLGDYLLTRVLATGGMARIYEGVDQKLGRHAAVKVLDIDKIITDETLTQRFQREARAVAKLEHQNIITIYQYGEQDGLYFLAMKLIKGKDLAQELTRLRRAGQRMEVKRGLQILDQVASALDVAHQADIVHRDVKPSNILLDQDDRATLTDFGLVLQPSIDTTFGTAFGTPRYIAPEQALSSNKALPQSDIYSLAVIAYEVMTGKTPFNGESPMEIALAHINEPPPALRSINPNIPDAAEREVLKALDKDPLKRHRTAGEFVKALRSAYPELDDQTALQVVTAPLKPDPFLESWDDPEPSTNVSITPPVSKPRKRYSPAMVVGGVVVVLAIAAGLFAFSGANQENDPVATSTFSPEIVVLPTDTLAPPFTTTPEIPATELPTEAPTESVVITGSEEGVPVRLIYTDTAFSIINDGDRDLDVNPLRFQRGEDQYSGENIVRRVVPVGTCFRLQLQGRQSDLPSGCGRLHAETLLPDPLHFFWRTEPINAETFEVVYNGQPIIACPTVPRAGSNECAFILPAPPAAS
jgi:serine/threonine protein kinase